MKKASYSVVGSLFLTAFCFGLVHANPGPPPTPVPEPGTWLLMGTGIAGLAAYRAFKNKKK